MNENEMDPVKEEKGLRIATLLLSWLIGLFLAASGISASYTIPRFRSMFEDLGGSIPSLTAMIVSVPAVVWIAAGCLLGVFAIAKDFLVPSRHKLVLNGILLLIWAAFPNILLFALNLPLVKMMKAVE